MSAVGKATAVSPVGEFIEVRELPEGWCLGRLPDVCAINMGQSPPGSTYNENGEGLPFFQGKADFGPVHPTVRKWCSAPSKIARPGDILISVRAPVGPTNLADRTCAIGRGLSALTPLGGIPSLLILYVLRLQEKELAEQGTGSTFTAITRDHLEAVELRLPPLAEQSRIVAKVEGLLARVNATRERLSRVPAILKRFRQAVLAAACSGRLTEDWREKRHDGDEGSLVAELIHGDMPSANEAVCELPSGWSRIKAGDAYHEASYGTSIKCERDIKGGVPVLRVPNIASGRLELADLKFAPREAVDRPSLILKSGDLIICRTNGSLDLVGKAAVIPRLAAPHSFASYLIRVRVDSNRLLPDYFHAFLTSQLGREQIEERARTTAGQFNLNLEILRGLNVPLPPIEEQREIICRTAKFLAVADTIESRLASGTIRSQKLTQAILAKAFRGDLVPTEAELARAEDRSYEPASTLLTRVRAESAQHCNRTRQRRSARRCPAPSGLTGHRGRRR